MKVRLALEEKGLDWSGQVIDIVGVQEQLEPWYVELNPKGVIPTLEVQNDTTEIVTDSASIIRFIASLPEGRSLLPTNNNNIELMEKLIDLADEVDLQILSYARHPSMENSGKILDTRIEKSLLLAEQYPELKSSYLVCTDRSKKSKTFRVNAKHIK
ncbi:glutathione S-transferase family protein [Psychrobacter sp. 72-O-c]|uniref:glutathione S-transferase family protein n=1 Tax=Psychrobacter sp. 72-O-c TaxID=2774125 RepID=UPI0019183492|nr:glutathione S-transferase family protein [Psychrobacter sp. 72-O-c]